MTECFRKNAGAPCNLVQQPCNFVRCLCKLISGFGHVAEPVSRVMRTLSKQGIGSFVLAGSLHVYSGSSEPELAWHFKI